MKVYFKFCHSLYFIEDLSQSLLSSCVTENRISCLMKYDSTKGKGLGREVWIRWVEERVVLAEGRGVVDGTQDYYLIML